MAVRIITTVLSLLFALEVRAAAPDVLVLGPPAPSRVVRAELERGLEERAVATARLPRRRKNPSPRALQALAQHEHVAIVVHVGRRGPRAWRVRAVTEDGRTLLDRTLRDRRIETSALLNDLEPLVRRTLITDYPPPAWHPETPQPLVPASAPVEVVDEGPNRLERVVLRGYGRTFASIESPSRR